MEAPVRGVDVQPHPVPIAERERLVDGIDGPEGGRPGGQHHGADGLGAEHLLERLQVHPSPGIGRHPDPPDAQQPAHPLVGVVALLAEGDGRTGAQLPGHEERLQVGDRPAGGEVAQEGLGVVEHRRDGGDRLALQRRRRRTAVQRVVVGIDQHRHQVGGRRGGVRRLEHLAGVAGMEEGVVVTQAAAELVQHPGRALGAHRHGGVGDHRRPAGLPPPHHLDGLQAGRVEVHRRKSSRGAPGSPRPLALFQRCAIVRNAICHSA